MKLDLLVKWLFSGAHKISLAAYGRNSASHIFVQSVHKSRVLEANLKAVLGLHSSVHLQVLDDGVVQAVDLDARSGQRGRLGQAPRVLHSAQVVGPRARLIDRVIKRAQLLCLDRSSIAVFV